MSWDAIGAIGELVGAAAVVVTLVYLALQVRQNNRLMQAQHRETNRNAVVQTYDPVSCISRGSGRDSYAVGTLSRNLC